MTIDDRYRARLQAAIASLRYWIPSISDTARIAETDGDDYWRINVEPTVAGACPFDLVLRSDGFHDLVIGGEVYEDMRTDDLDLFVPLACAIARGGVVRRHELSAATRMPLSVETEIRLDGGRVWRRRRRLSDLCAGSETILAERHYLPYRAGKS